MGQVSLEELLAPQLVQRAAILAAQDGWIAQFGANGGIVAWCEQEGMERCRQPEIERALESLEIAGGEIALPAVDLRGAYLRGLNLSRANLEGADLRGADLTRASLKGARLRGADLSGSVLVDCDLSDADLRGAKLIAADLKGSILRDANLADGDLRGVTGARFDHTFLRGTRFDLRFRDPWSALSAQYTGARFVILILLTMLYFLPRAIEAIGLSQFGQRGALVAEVLAELNSAQDAWGTDREGRSRMEPRGDKVRISVDIDSALMSRMRFDEAPKDLRMARRGLPPGVEAYRVMDVVLDRNRGWLAHAVALILLGYSTIRAVLTVLLARMRDAEDRTGTTPPWRTPIGVEGMPPHVSGVTMSVALFFVIPRLARAVRDSYGWMWRAHQALSIVFFVVLALLTLELYEVLMTIVYLPT